MAANNLGTAYIKIAPQMEGIQSAISSQLQKATSSAKISASSIAVGSVISKGVSTAFNAISSSLDKAISRVDTLNVFPKIMKNLGFSAEESNSAINKLSDRIEGLPTTLDEIVTYTQRLASSTGNLNKGMKNATSIAIAFNDAALAGGKGQEEANRAFEQFVQVVSRGRPTMQDWKIMLEVMPGQLKQVAKYMGENNDSFKQYAKTAKKTVSQLDGMDLYEWISENKSENAKKRLDQFTTALVELDEKGGSGITSFKDQVGDATKTIGNAMRLVPIRVAKAMAKVINAFGQGDIYDAVDKFTKSFNGIGDWIAKNVVPVIKNSVIPALKEVLKAIKGVIEFIAQNKWVQTFLVGLLQTIIAFKTISTIKSVITGIIAPIISLVGNLKTAAATFTAARAAGLTLHTSLGAVASSTAGATASVTGFAGAVSGATAKVLALTGGVAGLGAAVAGIGGTALNVTMIVQELQRQEQEAAIAAREYADKQLSVENAQKHVNKATEVGKELINDYQNALDAASNAELAYLNAKKDAEYRQSELNRLKKEGKQGTDEYRIAEIQLQQAEATRDAKLKEYNKAQKESNELLNQYKDNALTAVNEQNKLTIAQEAAKQQYAVIASQLDNLSNSTLKYKDMNGKLREATKKDSEESAQYLAEQLARTDSTWKRVVEIARTQGISFSAACKKAGEEAGKGAGWMFSLNLQKVSPLATQAADQVVSKTEFSLNRAVDGALAAGKNTASNFAGGIKSMVGNALNAGKSAAEKAISGAKSKTGEAYSIGKNMTSGTSNGLLDKSALATLAGNAVKMIQKALAAARKAADEHSPSKETAKIGMFMSLGLAQGIDDYADEAVESAKKAAEATVNAFNGGDGISADSASAKPYSASQGILGGNSVTQYNTFNQVDTNLDMNEISKRLGWQVSVAL